MELKQQPPGTLSDRLLNNCLEFYPMFARWPTYKEVLAWEKIIGGKVSLPTFKATIRRARQVINDQYT